MFGRINALSETLLKRLSEAGAGPDDGILLIGRGSRLSMNATAVDKHTWYVSNHGYPIAGYGFVSSNEPDISMAVASLLERKPSRIVVLPVFMYRCRTVTEVIPEIIGKCGIPAPVVFAEPLGTDDLLLDDMDRKVPEGW